ncbi:translocation protein sec63 [Myriangium duriaei CBS 260.36]|uniref:Translocation protein sec63 n=1 Tax=Myriangium duriaei CBS 260.36 TaxID=1168546 RepID=A0A9P4J1S9_9PEZI|nr:translocation protein sec63 [Myriangium duriaei CBS 260.36]
MSTDYSYDDQGQFFPFFFVTLSALVVIPVTYSVLKPSTQLESTAPKIDSSFKPKDGDLVEGQKRRQKKRERKLKRMLLAVAGWAFIAFNVWWMVNTQRLVPKIWDPYEILDVKRGSTERQVQSRYRKLSLTMHPDKARPNEAKNETVDFINERWVEITKAYKTLTDEDVRNNYEQYGNPDGKQSTSIGIALPQFLVAEGNGKYVMIVYGALLGILLPYFVGSWWYGSQKRTKEKVFVTSVGKLFKEFSERTDANGVISALSVGDEYNDILKGHKSDAGLGQIEKRILAPGSTTATAAGLTKKDSAKLQDLDDATRRKALALIWAYLGRIELSDSALNDEKIEVAPTALALNDAFISISLAYMFTSPVVAAYQTSQNVIQAIPPGAPPLLQLPHLDRDAIKHIEGAALTSQRKHLTVQAFMDIPDSQRREITKNTGITSKQYDSLTKVASQLPRLVVERTFFKVAGEKYVLPGSLVQFVVKARFIPPGSVNVPEIRPEDLEDKDPDETDTKAQREEEEEARQHQPPLTHAPYFARDHAPRWHLFLTDVRQGKIAVPPFTYQTFDKPILTADGKPTYEMQTLKMQFQAPPSAGLYRFQMHLMCDSYVGFDDKRDVSMTIEDESKAEEVDEEDEISEPEEDSLAGQMAALKGQSAPGKPRRKIARKEDDSSDEESGTDEDENSASDTDTDTDTDEE